MHALVVDLAEALSPFLSPDIAPDLFRRRGFALCEVKTFDEATPALMEAFWEPELPARYWAECKLRLSQLRTPSMHALVVDLAEARCPFLSPDIAPDLFRRRGYDLY